MDFFESQDSARRNTKLLLFLFGAAVLSLVVMTNLLFLFLVNYSNSYTVSTGAGGLRFSWGAVVLITAGVVLLVGLGSLFRIVSLAKGGEAVAGMLDGELLAEAGDSLPKRRLLNVVEEMAIASGTPVPPVYLIPDDSINAFAAGYSPGDAVIGITRGAVENLNRDQLQGVIAHEFSHILNGDMRLNIRLMGVLYGILMVAIVGRILLQGGSRSRRREGAGILAVGVGLLVLGYVGKFFGSLIKAAVSRQREFLADASAVQFTRNPEGIGGALKRIGGYAGGSILHNPKSEEMSHAFFTQGVKVMFSSIMATHPPLEERIRRIDPHWDGAFITRTVPDADEEAPGAPAGASGFAGTGGRMDADQAIRDIGNPGTKHLEHARNILSAIPLSLSDAAHETYSARAVIYLVLLDADPLVRSRQVDYLAESADAFVLSRFNELLPQVDAITPEMRLPLVEMSLASLRQLSTGQYEKFKQNIEALIHEDHKVGLEEWALHRVVTKHLGEALEGKRSSARHTTLEKLKAPIACLLSMLAYADRSAGVSADVAFEAGRSAIELDISLAAKTDLKLSRLNESIEALADLRPLRKPKLLKACIATITADGVVAPIEAELVRAIADSLDCPMPPISIDGHRV